MERPAVKICAERSVFFARRAGNREFFIGKQRPFGLEALPRRNTELERPEPLLRNAMFARADRILHLVAAFHSRKAGEILRPFDAIRL